MSEVECSGKLDGPDGISALVDTKGSPIDVLVINDAEVAYIDDEGLLKLSEGEAYPFTDLPNGRLIAGKLLVIGNDAEGDSAPTKLTIPELGKLFTFTRRTYLGIQNVPAREIDHPLLGKTWAVGSQAKFGPPLAD
jgi:hypothetical protein